MKIISERRFNAMVQATLSHLRQLIPYMTVLEREMLMSEMYGLLEDNPSKGLTLNKPKELYTAEEISHLDSHDFERDCLSF